ncbi:UNVERIFIED_CONTAM: TonB-dependent receptor, partial [Salmonella enterica subsp. enterica serovar Weltevreden]
GAEQRSGPWTLNYTLGYASAEEDNPDALGASFVGEGLAIGYDAANRRIPRLFAEDAAYADPLSFALDEIVAERSSTQETETSLALDFRRDLQFGSAPGFLKFGAKARLREKDG